MKDTKMELLMLIYNGREASDNVVDISMIKLTKSTSRNYLEAILSSAILCSVPN